MVVYGRTWSYMVVIQTLFKHFHVLIHYSPSLLVALPGSIVISDSPHYIVLITYIIISSMFNNI